MFTSFHKALLGTIVTAALVLALVIAAKGPSAALAAGGPLALGGAGAATVIAGGGIAPGIVTSGDATVKVKPDVAIVTVGAIAQASTAAEAQAAVAERVDRILKQAKGLGVADRDTKNAGYQIQPQYVSGPGSAPRITGYQASQQILLTLRNVDGVGKALDALTQNEAANTLSVRLTVDDPKPAAADARAQAIADARSKAAAMAKAAGVTLGRVISVSDLSSPSVSTGDFKAFDRAAAAPATQIPVGDLDVTVRVQVQFEIQ